MARAPLLAARHSVPGEASPHSSQDVAERLAEVHGRAIRTFRSVSVTIVIGCLAACAATGTGSRVASDDPLTSAGTEPAGSLDTPAGGATAPSNPTPDLSDCADPIEGDFPHDAPGLEALLPPMVAGREMRSWSATGWCLMHTGWFGTEEEFAELVAGFEEDGVKPEDLRMAAIGPSDADAPPYFVYVVYQPHDEPTTYLVATKLTDMIGVINQDGFLRVGEPETIAHRGVRVGSIDELVQGEHQRGFPIQYASDEYFFLVITDDDAWAADALSQLP